MLSNSLHHIYPASSTSRHVTSHARRLLSSTKNAAKHSPGQYHRPAHIYCLLEFVAGWSSSMGSFNIHHVSGASSCLTLYLTQTPLEQGITYRPSQPFPSAFCSSPFRGAITCTQCWCAPTNPRPCATSHTTPAPGRQSSAPARIVSFVITPWAIQQVPIASKHAHLPRRAHACAEQMRRRRQR